VPHYLVIGALVGSSYAVASGAENDQVVSYSAPSVIGTGLLIAAIALLFAARYPPACMTWWSASTGGATGWWCTWP